MYFLIKPLFVTLIIQDVYSSACTVCVTEPLITSSVKCPICKQSEYDNQFEPANFPICRFSKYRTYDGSCNNLNNPKWGMSNSPYSRIVQANYGDNILSLALAVNGQPRPSARTLATDIFPDHDNNDFVTLLTMQWGQLTAHDMGLSLPVTLDNIDCCNPNLRNKEILCLPIMISSNDYFYSKFNVSCISNVRTNTTLNGFYKKGPAQQINAVTHMMDASLVYGSSLKIAINLREFTGGRLKIQKSIDGRDFLPNVPLDQVETECIVKNKTEPCYVAGDVRVNQNTEITVLQNLLLREHNRIAGALEKLHPEWNDEILYQESRAILIAEVQHITYGEFLEWYLGKETMEKYSLYPRKTGYTKYNRTLKLSVSNSFVAAAYRIGHSGIQGYLSKLSYTRRTLEKVPISDWMNRPCIIQETGNFDQFLLGLTNQPMQFFDEYYSKQITNLMFRGFQPFGQDLLSLDIERGRDHGIAPYINYLEVCTGFKAKAFFDLTRYIDVKFIKKLEQHYESVKDIDLIIGGILETKVYTRFAKQPRFGPTFLCLVTEQFYLQKWADRFWYEVEGQPHSLKESQLNEIRKASLSRIICDNSDNIKNIAVNSFLPSSKYNQIVDCDRIPQVNLSKW